MKEDYYENDEDKRQLLDKIQNGLFNLTIAILVGAFCFYAYDKYQEYGIKKCKGFSVTLGKKKQECFDTLKFIFGNRNW